MAPASPPVDSDALPARLGGRYEPERILGRGGFGRVVLCMDRELRRPVAIKLLEMLDRPEAVERFVREARITAKLSHPGIVGLYDHGVEADRSAWIVYEYIRGVTLETVARTEPPPDQDTLCRWGRELALALDHVHRAGISHRDLKPANVMRREDGRLVICDFGLARDAELTRLTATGKMVGTPLYLAPECWLDLKSGPELDQWAVAAILFELAYGEVPYDKLGLEARLAAFKTDRKVRIPGANLGRLPDLEVVLLKALEPRPADRYPDMAALAAALTRPGTLTRELSAPSFPPSGSARDTRVVEPPPGRTPGAKAPAAPAPRAPSLPLLVGIGALTGIMAAGLYAVTRPDPPPPPPSPAADPEPAPADPLAEALETAHGAMVRTSRLRRPDGSFPSPTSLEPAQIALEEPAVLDSRSPVQWKRLLDALAAWLAVPRDLDRGPDRERFARIAFGFLLNRAAIHRWYNVHRGDDQLKGFGATSVSPEVEASTKGWNLVKPELDKITLDFALALPQEAVSPVPLVALKGTLYGLIGRKAAQNLFREVHKRLMGGASGEDAYRLALTEETMMAALHVEVELPMALRLEAMDETLGLLEKGLPGVPVGLLAERRSRMVVEAIRAVRMGSGPLEPADATRVRRAMALAGQARTVDPEAVTLATRQVRDLSSPGSTTYRPVPEELAPEVGAFLRGS